MDINLWPRVQRCFCCVSLRNGSLIIGYASLLTSALSLSAVSFSLYRVVDYIRSHKGKPDPNGHSAQETENMAISLYIAHAYFILVLLYYSVISLLLIFGVHRNKPNYLRYYFNAALLLLVLASTLVVITLVFFGVVASLPLLKWCLILFYCLIVVRSTCFEMEELNKPPDYELKNLQEPQEQQAALLV